HVLATGRSGAQRARASFPPRRSSDRTGGSADKLPRQLENHVFLGCDHLALFDQARSAEVLDDFADEDFWSRGPCRQADGANAVEDRKSTRLNSRHVKSSYAVFCLQKR